MADGFFNLFSEGRLELPVTPVDSVPATVAWGDIMTNRILVGVSVLLILFAIPDFLRLFPVISECFLRKKANSELEHSVSTARQRNVCALLMVIPFCAVADRFKLYAPSFMDFIPVNWSAPATVVIFLVFLLVREVLFRSFCPRMGQEAMNTVHHTPYNYFIRLTSVMLATCGIFFIFKLPDSVCHTVLLWEIAIVYMLSTIRCSQFLRQQCSGLATILYLCALEILPAAMIIVSAVML